MIFPTIKRQEQRVYGFRLSDVDERVQIPVNSSESITVTMRREFGSSWSTYVPKIQRLAPGDSVSAAFSSAKTIAAGGGVAAISSTELEGVSWIEILWSSGAAEASGTTAFIIVNSQIPTQTVIETPAGSGVGIIGGGGSLGGSGGGGIIIS